MAETLGDSLKVQSILLSNLVGRIQESGSNYYELRGVMTMDEFRALRRALSLLVLEAKAKADEGK